MPLATLAPPNGLPLAGGLGTVALSGGGQTLSVQLTGAPPPRFVEQIRPWMRDWGIETLDLHSEGPPVASAAEPLARQIGTTLPTLVQQRLGPANTGAFFALSTGRCGTQTLASVLGLATNATVHHHPAPMMVREAGAAYAGRLDRRAAVWRGRAALIHAAWSAGKVHGETDHNMTAFADHLAADLPTSRFLVLVRHPADAVRSAMRRGHYQGHPWDIGRFRPRPGDPAAADWATRAPFDKAAWMWAATYREAFARLAHVDDERVTVVRFEDLVAGPAETERLYRFLDLEGFDADAVAAQLARPLNAQRQGAFPRPEAWEDAWWTRLWREVGPIAEGFGYRPRRGPSIRVPCRTRRSPGPGCRPSR